MRTYTVSDSRELWSCDECGAVIHGDTLIKHSAWHDRQASSGINPDLLASALRALDRREQGDSR